MIILTYNLLFLVSLIIALPFLAIFLSKKELKMRLGVYEKSTAKQVAEQDFVWFHCASVGEVNAVKPLLSALKNKYPQTKILMTTMTATGLETARNCNTIDQSTLLPLDLILLYKRLFKRFKPKALIIVETELWFSLLCACRLSHIPVFIVNGRVSDKSFNKYMSIRLFVRNGIRHVSFVGAQSEENKDRYLALGFQNVHNTQNLKFCTQLPDVHKDMTKKEWDIGSDDFIIVWGSSREGEEEILLSIQRKLKKEIPNLLLIVAPRHLSRLPDVKELLRNRRYSLLSEIPPRTGDIILIDTIGKLVNAYSIADIAIIGGSFIDYGGHNPLEPLFYEKATIIGQYYSSCRDLVSKLAANEAIIISNKQKLLQDILSLYEDEELRKAYGKKGKNTVVQNACSVEENIKHIEKYLSFR